MINYHDAISELKHFIHSDSLTEAPSNETCLLAIEALQEKAQREQGCRRCKEKRDDWQAAPHEFRIDGNVLYYSDSQLGWEGTAANYCFNCGRKLDREGS